MAGQGFTRYLSLCKWGLHGTAGRTAEELVGKLVDMWRGPIDTLGKAGRALEGIEALLGGAAGGSFDLQV